MNSFKQEPEELDKFLKLFEEDLENIHRVRKFCDNKDIDVDFKIHPKAQTCKESAEYSDVSINKIVKTLIFKTSNEFIAVLAPGNKRVDAEKVKEIRKEEEIRMATPEEVENHTGYVIGGVSPFDLEIPVYMEAELLEHDIVRPAAGSRIVGLETDPEELRDIIVEECVNIVK